MKVDALTREVNTHPGDGEALFHREAKYSALRQVYSGSETGVRVAVRALTTPCVHDVACPLCLRPLSTAASLAVTWCGTDIDVARLSAEYERVFVGAGGRALVSAYASDYMPDTEESIRNAVTGYYQRLDYPSYGHGPADDPLHISSQLGFMAHCLDRERCGLGGRLDVSLFFADQLLPWAPMFARAAFAATTDPVLRFAALALEQVLKCDSMLILRSDGA